jgi:hypothetical protein
MKFGVAAEAPGEGAPEQVAVELTSRVNTRPVKRQLRSGPPPPEGVTGLPADVTPAGTGGAQGSSLSSR